MKDKKILLMAVDLGTSFIKVGIYSVDGICIALKQEAVKQECPVPRSYIQHGEQLFGTVLHCMSQVVNLVEEKSKIEAIAFTGQMAGMMGVNHKWEDVTSWSCSLDTRYLPYVNHQILSSKEELLQISGTSAPIMSPKIKWFRKEYPKESSEISKYMMIGSYIIGKLSGCDIEEAVIDSSYITWTGLADVKKRQWSEELCSKAEISRNLLPRIVDADTVCGFLSNDMAVKIGLKDGIPLVAGAGDKVAGCVGAGLTQPGDMIFEAGSYGGFSCLSDDYRPDMEHHNYDVILSAETGKYLAHKYIPGSGITLKWFRDNSSLSFGEMDSLASMLTPGCNGLKAVGLLGGSAMPFDGKMKGAWMGFDWSHRKEHFYRALLESFAFEVALTLDSIDYNSRKGTGSVVKIIGGGAKSETWSQILADVTGKSFHSLNREDTTLWGTAIIAGKAVGIFPDMAIGANWVKVSKVYDPVHQNTEIYMVLKQQYEKLKANISGCNRD